MESEGSRDSVGSLHFLLRCAVILHILVFVLCYDRMLVNILKIKMR